MQKSVLIIDDEPQFVEIVEKRLSSLYKIFTAYDGRTGVRLALEHKPDLVIIDILMPGVDGYEVLAELKKHSNELRKTAFVMLTAVGQTQSINKVLEMGADDYFIKPFPLEELVRMVKKLLN